MADYWLYLAIFVLAFGFMMNLIRTYFQETALKKNILRMEKEIAQLQQSIIKLCDHNIKTLGVFTSALKNIESKKG